MRESRLETDLARAELHALRLEIEPHFLFNTLNVIAALVRLKDNSRAVEMLAGLGGFLRSNLDRPHDQFVTLAAEITWVQRYIHLQQARFGDRLEVDYQIADECLEYRVPTLLLQPIVENALRHGLARQTRRCRVRINATCDATALSIAIIDDGVGLPEHFDINQRVGTGLRNVRSRLDHLYASEASFDISRGDSGGTIVTMRLPASQPAWLTRATA